MAMTRQLSAVLCAVLFSVAAHAAVIGNELNYQVDGVTLKGYLAYDDSIQGVRPGVLVVHEWWGHNEYARQRARMLAELGYTAFAVDMYGDGKLAAHPDDASKFSSELAKNAPLAKARFLAAMNFLQSQPTTDSARVGAIGYCFGGGVVLNMARAGVDLKGVVSFHGSLGATVTAEKGKVTAPILVLTGADDQFVAQDQVNSFKAEMDGVGAQYTVISYAGAKHSFTSPEADELGKKFNMPLAYNAAADKASWEEMQKFFKRVLQ
jgi:dienelactone hydrolase